jgi:hypothetical protein
LVFSKLTGWIGEAREGEDLKGRQLKKLKGVVERGGGKGLDERRFLWGL